MDATKYNLRNSFWRNPDYDNLSSFHLQIHKYAIKYKFSGVPRKLYARGYLTNQKLETEQYLFLRILTWPHIIFSQTNIDVLFLFL